MGKDHEGDVPLLKKILAALTTGVLNFVPSLVSEERCLCPFCETAFYGAVRC